jgi:hypothetical protein
VLAARGAALLGAAIGGGRTKTTGRRRRRGTGRRRLDGGFVLARLVSCGEYLSVFLYLYNNQFILQSYKKENNVGLYWEPDTLLPGPLKNDQLEL